MTDIVTVACDHCGKKAEPGEKHRTLLHNGWTEFTFTLPFYREQRALDHHQNSSGYYPLSGPDEPTVLMACSESCVVGYVADKMLDKRRYETKKAAAKAAREARYAQKAKAKAEEEKTAAKSGLFGRKRK